MMAPQKTTNEPNWLEQKNKLRKAFPVLTDADLNFDISRKSDMLKKLQVKLGKTEAELQAVTVKL